MEAKCYYYVTQKHAVTSSGGEFCSSLACRRSQASVSMSNNTWPKHKLRKQLQTIFTLNTKPS